MWLERRAPCRVPSAEGLCGSTVIAERRAKGSPFRRLLVLHRRAHLGDGLSGRTGDLLDERGDLLAGQGVNLDLELVGLGEIGWVLHGGVEGAPQRLEARR